MKAPTSRTIAKGSQEEVMKVLRAYNYIAIIIAEVPHAQEIQSDIQDLPGPQ